MTLFVAFEILGTIAFAVSGAVVAISKKMDIFGVAILGMTTAVGGGILRDLILGITPPAAFHVDRRFHACFPAPGAAAAALEREALRHGASSL